MKRIDLMKEHQRLLKQQICENLDLLIGSVVRSPAMMYHGLTTKVKIMTERHQKVRALIQHLSKINWELLKLESEK